MRDMTRELESPAAAFVQQFRDVWAAPSVESLDALTHPDVCYLQPLHPDVHGRERAGASAFVESVQRATNGYVAEAVYDIFATTHGRR